MCDVYRVSSSVKVEQMEAELSRQLSALRVEIEESGSPQGAMASRCYSSVPPPKDVSFFRVEREHALRRGLQVAEAVPVQSPADVMQRELESCLSLEYTPDSLPPLLHQFFTDRSYHLAQIKYLLMLRWRRFCRHSSVIEKLYPHYKDQMSCLTSEYEDAVQRARRLSASREKILTGRGSVAELPTQDDVVVYLRWLVCHLHAVQPIHNFLRVLHYIPACERRDEPQTKPHETQHETQHVDAVSGPADGVPRHTALLEEFLPELQSLLAHFLLAYDTRDLKTTADEMELFSSVWREFRTIFGQQEQMKTFPQYGGSEVRGQWGRKSPRTALRKEADWIPFILVKPKRDPWQQKLITKLKEKKSVDELLKMSSRLLQVSDLLHVAAALKDHAAHVGDQSATTSSASSSREAKRQKISEIWTSVYSSASLTQEGPDQFTTSRGRRGHRKKSQTSSTANGSCSLEDSLQLLRLDEGLEEGASDPIVTRGAYLSLLHLRHLKLRQLQRISLGLLNYLRSVERTLTFDLAGLQLEEGELCSTAEETGWMNAARGGRGEAGGLGSLQFSHNTPVDCKVRCSEFMEFAEVENLHDFYSAEERLVHAQDQRGLYIVYDAALKDLQELEDELLLVGSRFVQRDGMERTGSAQDFPTRAGLDVDRVAVLLDLWTCETEFLESKVQLLNCYYEAYQHASGAEERFALAGVVTDIMHSRPQLDLNQDYFVQAYRAQIGCLQSHQQLIRSILDNQIEKQRQYLQRIWRDGCRGSTHDFGMPSKHIPKHLVSLGGSGPALMSTFLLEVHPSLCLSSAVYHALVQAHAELCQLHGASGITETLALRQQLLQRALQRWKHLASPGASYSPQIQKDLFSGVFFEDPISVQKLGLSLVGSAEEKEGREKQLFVVETFSKLLELVTIRHRLLESASETAHLAQLYRNAASELDVDGFHLHLRPVQFEVAEQKDGAERRPVFITAILEDDSAVDRFTPSQLPLSIQELDENQIGRFSFSSQEAVTRLVNKRSIENLQVTLACQVTQKNALMSAVKLLRLCHAAQDVSRHLAAQNEAACHSDKDVNFDSTPGSDINNPQKSNSSPSKGSARTPTGPKERLTEAFVSIQLEKVGLRDEMLNSFVKKKQAAGGLLKTPEEAAEIKRSLIIDFLKKFSSRMSQYCVRAQIVAYYLSLSFLLEDIPSVRRSLFTIGRATDAKVLLDSGVDLRPDPRTFRLRPQRLLSADGTTLFNLWYIPHFSEVLHMFRNISACGAALHHTLQIVSALHDIISYLVSFSRLGNTEDSWSCRRGRGIPGSLSADWGGAEGIEAELLEIQRQVDLLSAPGCPESVGRLLQLRRQVLLLQFDAAVRHFIREAFLSSGDVASYHSVSDNMAAALPLLSDGLQPDVFSLTLPVPPPLEARGCQAQRMFPWRSFIACDGLFPLDVWDVSPIERCMQLCLSGLSDRSRLKANAAILGVSLLLEDVLNSEREAGPVCLHGNDDDLLHNGKPDEEAEEEKRKTGLSARLPQDPVRVQSALKGFLLLTKQLQVFKEIWTRGRLGARAFRTPSSCQQFVKLYRDDVFHPSMRALAQQMGKQRDYEVLMCGGQSLLPPPGASEVDVKAWQLHNLLESTECDMIRAVQRRVSGELTLVASERTRRDTGLPTELWKKGPLKYSLSPERPQVVETFVQQLMEGAEEAQGQLSVSQRRLQQCLTQLGCSLTERERRSFLLYSQFYEQILQHETRLLYQSEQDLKILKEDSQTSDSHKEVDVACRGMMLEISALQTRVAHLEEEKRTLEEQLTLKFKGRYDPLVRHLFSTCIQLKAQLDEYHGQMEQDVSEMVKRIRGEGVDRILKLRRKHGCTKDNDGLAHLKKEDVHELSRENSRLTALLGKQKALSRWRQAVDQEKLYRRLLEAQQREITCRSDALRVKMTSEEEVIILQEELEAARKALSCSQAECSGTKTLLSRKAEDLQLARHQSAQEARSRQELDGYREQSLEQMRAAAEDGERRLRGLSGQLDRGSRMQQLHRQRSAKEMRQVRSQLQQELRLKQEAFQQVNRLQHQLTDLEAASSRCTSTAGRQQCSLSHAVLQDSAAEPRHQRAAAARSRSHARIERPKAAAPRLRVLTADTLPDLRDSS